MDIINNPFSPLYPLVVPEFVIFSYEHFLQKNSSEAFAIPVTCFQCFISMMRSY